MSTKIRRKYRVWKDEFYFKIYDLAKSGMTNRSIAGALKLEHRTLKRWLHDHPALKQELSKVRTLNNTNKTQTFIDYVYYLLPKKLRKLWDKISAIEDAGTGPGREGRTERRIEALLGRRSTRTKQHLFFHALIASNFNASEACRKLCLKTSILTSWMKDPEFAKLVDEFNWHKGNFFEGHLIQLVKDGDSHATVFANRTFNRKRGYNDKMEHEVSGEINHNHTVTVDELDGLSLDTRRQLLDAIRAKREPKLIEGAVVLDAPKPLSEERKNASQQLLNLLNGSNRINDNGGDVRSNGQGVEK